jgi:hypothetical protein
MCLNLPGYFLLFAGNTANYRTIVKKSQRLLEMTLQMSHYVVCPKQITNDVPLILKMWDIRFFSGKIHNKAFQGIFRGGINSRGQR